ncbi:penicillin acylase family protein, partial [bacterium]|nr:penicillin acylase family protein [bacterium]
MTTPSEETPARRHLSPRLVSVTLALLLCLLSWGGSSLPWGPLPPPGDLFSPVGGIWSVARQARPPAREQIHLPGLTGEVTVQVDDLGVPHIFATSDEDAALTLGYLHARERLAQMDLQRRVASGTLSALVGTDGLDNDRLMRTVGLRRAAAASLEQMDPEEPTLKVLEAYSAGVNAYIQEAQPHRLPLEYKLLGVRSVEPWTPLDSATFGKFMAWELAHSWDDLFLAELVASLGPEVVDELYPMDRPYEVPMVDRWPPGGKRISGIGGRGSGIEATDAQPLTRVAAADILGRARAAGQLHGREFPIGSNNWAVAADRSSEGVPLLSSDPHLGYQLPSLWYQAHLVTPEMKVTGVTLVGMPFVAIGHTDRVAWGLTNTQADVVDYYVERT